MKEYANITVITRTAEIGVRNRFPAFEMYTLESYVNFYFFTPKFSIVHQFKKNSAILFWYLSAEYFGNSFDRPSSF